MTLLKMRQPGESGKTSAGKHPGHQPIRDIHTLKPWDSSHRSRPCHQVCKTLLRSFLSFDNTFYFNLWQITLPTKVRLVKAMVFPVVMYGCESWTVSERRRIDAFELWCWRRLLRVPWTERRSNQSILKEISPGCSLEGMILKLKLQYFAHHVKS